MRRHAKFGRNRSKRGGDMAIFVSSDGRKSTGAEGRCHGNQFWDAICHNGLYGL